MIGLSRSHVQVGSWANVYTNERGKTRIYGWQPPGWKYGPGDRSPNLNSRVRVKRLK